MDGPGSSLKTGIELFALPNATARGFSSTSASSSQKTAIFDFPVTADLAFGLTTGSLGLSSRKTAMALLPGLGIGGAASSSRNTEIELLDLCDELPALDFVEGAGSSSRKTEMGLSADALLFELFVATGRFPSGSSSRKTAIELLDGAFVLVVLVAGDGTAGSSSRKTAIGLLVLLEDGTEAGSGSSLKTGMTFPRDFDPAGFGGGGGVSLLASAGAEFSPSSSGAGSLNTMIFDVPPEAVRCARPGWRRVVPAAFVASLIFSLTRDLRVPSSGQAEGGSSSLFSSSPKSGSGESTKTGMRAFGWGRAAAGEGRPVGIGLETAREEDRVARVEDRVDVSPKTARRPFVGAALGSGSAGAGSDGRVGEAIMRFWKSAYFVSRRSSGAALRAMPKR